MIKTQIKQLREDIRHYHNTFKNRLKDMDKQDQLKSLIRMSNVIKTELDNITKEIFSNNLKYNKTKL